MLRSPAVRHAVLAVVTRSGVAESMHAGSALALGPDGDVVAEAGDPVATVLPRSALKPLQLVAMLRAGLDLEPTLLALAAASHSGEPFHLTGVRRILAAADLDLDRLRNTPGLPLDDAARRAWEGTDRAASSLAQNCSGKHAAMLATCARNGWSTADYLDPGHPLHRGIAATVAELAGESVSAVAVDGCGAPAYGLSLTGLARAFARLGTAAPGTAEGRVADAVRRHPEWLGGTDRGITRLLRACPGLVAKDGAEGVLAGALPNGSAFAVKIGDGAPRAVLPVAVALLGRLGIREGLDAVGDEPVLGHGRRVGAIEVVGV